MKKRRDRGKLIENISPEFILAGHTPRVRALAERLRKLIRQSVPAATETAYPVWHGIGYRHLESGYFCAIFPQEEMIKLGFEYGVMLPDPEGLLEGTGKQVRYVYIRGMSDIRIRPIKRLLLAAIDLRAPVR